MDPRSPALAHEALLENAAWVRQLAAELVRDPAAAEDLAQETWLAFLRARPDTSRPLRPWLARVLRNAAGLRARRSAGGRAREAEVARAEAVPSAHELVERAEQQQHLARAVLTLDEPYRTALLLRYYEGLAPAEIARVRGLPPATVRSHLMRGLHKLRERLDEQHGGDRRAWVALLEPLLLPSAPGLGAALALAGVLAAAAALGLYVHLARPASAPETPDVAAAAREPSRVASVGAPAPPDARAPLAPAPRALRLVDAAGRPLHGYELRVDGASLRSDAEGRVELPAGARALVPVDDARLAREEQAGHARPERRLLNRAEIELPAGVEALPLPSGPVYRLVLEAPAPLDPAELEARLHVADAGLGQERAQLAPLRAGDAPFDGPWVRFAAEPEGDGPWVLELRDEPGFWRGRAALERSAGVDEPVRVVLRRTGVVEGRVDGDLGAQPERVTLALTAPGEPTPRALTRPEADGRYALRWVEPGALQLALQGASTPPRPVALELHAGERLAVDLALPPAPAAGPVAGVVTSRSGAYTGQLLVYLLDERGDTHGVDATTWRAGEDGRMRARFRFESAPPGPLRLDVLSLADSVGFTLEPPRFDAPIETLVATLEDQRPTAQWSVEPLDARSGAPLERCELRVRVEGGFPRRYQGERSAEGAWTWTLMAGGLRWNRFEGPPLRALDETARFEWSLRAEGYAPVEGDEARFDVLEPGRRHLAVALRPE